MAPTKAMELNVASVAADIELEVEGRLVEDAADMVRSQGC